jgi:hypothetical protein
MSQANGNALPDEMFLVIVFSMPHSGVGLTHLHHEELVVATIDDTFDLVRAALEAWHRLLQAPSQ